MKQCDILNTSILIFSSVFTCVLLAAPCIFPEAGRDETTYDLNYLNTSILAVLTPLVDSTSFAAKTLSAGGDLSSAEAQPVLNGLLSTSEHALSYAAIAQDGTIIVVAPESYAWFLQDNHRRE